MVVPCALLAEAISSWHNLASAMPGSSLVRTESRPSLMMGLRVTVCGGDLISASLGLVCLSFSFIDFFNLRAAEMRRINPGSTYQRQSFFAVPFPVGMAGEQLA